MSNFRLGRIVVLSLWILGICYTVMIIGLFLWYGYDYLQDSAGVRHRKMPKSDPNNLWQPPKLRGSKRSLHHPSFGAVPKSQPDALNWIVDIDQVSDPIEILERTFGPETTVLLSNTAVYSGLSINQLLELDMGAIACAEARKLARKKLNNM